MDFTEAVSQLVRDNPDCDHSEVRSAMDNETKSECENLQGSGTQRQYERAVETAHRRITDWLKSGSEYAISRADTWRDVAKFAASHRSACVWAVCTAIAREEEAAASNKAIEDNTPDYRINRSVQP